MAKESLCEDCKASGICNLEGNASQAIQEAKRHQPQVPGHIKRVRSAIAKFNCEKGAEVSNLLDRAEWEYDNAADVQNSKKNTDTTDSRVQHSGGGGLGVWNSESTGTVLWYDERGMAVTPAMQRLAAAKTVIRDNLGMPRVASAIQKPFDKLERYANEHVGGVIFEAAPIIFIPLSLLAHGLARVALGPNRADELVGKMYQPADQTNVQSNDTIPQQYLAAA